MLTEFKNIKQSQNAYRRLFNDADFELYLWFNINNHVDLTGFQIIDHRENISKAITWKTESGVKIAEIDSGEIGILDKTPILVSNDIPSIGCIIKEFVLRLDNLESKYKDIIISVLSKYKDSK